MAEVPTGNTREQPVPLWAAYNSLLVSPGETTCDTDKAYAMPLINYPAHEWKTLTTSLMQLHKLNTLVTGPESRRPLCVWMDMDLYKRALKLQYLQPELYKDKWIESPGQFHIVLCALRRLGQTIEGSGLDDALVDSDIYSSVTDANNKW